MSAARQYCDELIALIDRFRELGGDPREFLDKPLVLFQINSPAADGMPPYEPLQDYVELCARLKTRIRDREKRARSRPRRRKRR